MDKLIFWIAFLVPSIFASIVPSSYTYLHQWEFATNSTDSHCDYAVSVSSILLGTCDYVSPAYQQTVCTGSFVQVYNCSDSTCNHCVLLAQEPTNQCAPSVGYSIEYTCSNSIAKLDSNDVITYQTYTDNACSTKIVQSSSVLANYCFGNEEYQEYICNIGQVMQVTCTDPECSQNCVKDYYNTNCIPFSSGGSVSISCS